MKYTIITLSILFAIGQVHSQEIGQQEYPAHPYSMGATSHHFRAKRKGPKLLPMYVQPWSKTVKIRDCPDPKYNLVVVLPATPNGTVKIECDVDAR